MESDVLFLLDSVDGSLQYDHEDKTFEKIIDLINSYLLINISVYKLPDNEFLLFEKMLLEKVEKIEKLDSKSLQIIFSMTQSKKEVDISIFSETKLIKIFTIKINKKNGKFTEFVQFLENFVKFFKNLKEIYFQVLIDNKQHALYIEETIFIFKTFRPNFFKRYDLYYSYIDIDEQINIKFLNKNACLFLSNLDFNHDFDLDNILDGTCPCCFFKRFDNIDNIDNIL